MNKRKIIFSVVTILSLFLSIVHPVSANESLKNREGNLDGILSSPAPNTFSFAYLGDCKGNNLTRFKHIVRDINRHHPSFFVVNGDMVNEPSEREYRFYVEELEEERKGLPVFHTVGNHDIFSRKIPPSYKEFKKFFGATYYWFSFQNSLFIILDGAGTTIDAKQFQWLKDILKTKRDSFTHTFVFMHVPPFDCRKGHHHCMEDSGAEEFMRLMERYRVTRVCTSHIHAYHREVINGVTYIISGGGGAHMVIDPPFYHYILIEVEGDRVSDRPIEIENVRSAKDIIEYTLEVIYPPSSPVFWAIIFSLIILLAIPIIIAIMLVRKIRKRSN